MHAGGQISEQREFTLTITPFTVAVLATKPRDGGGRGCGGCVGETAIDLAPNVVRSDI